MDVQDLHIFARVASLQNLSAVGTELGLTPGTISKRIQALEEALAVRLFERTTRSIRITDEGARFLDHVQRILAEINQARSLMAASSGNPVGKLKVSAPHIVGTRYVAPALPSFFAEYSDVEIQLDITDRPVNLHEEGYDVAIRCGTLTDSTLIAKRLANDRIIICGSPGYFKGKEQPAAPNDLSQHSCLTHGETEAWTFGAPGQETAIRVSGHMRSDSSEILRAAALAGQGLIKTTEIKVAEELESGRLISVLGAYIDNSATGIYALYVSGRHILPRQRVFLDHLADWFRSSKRVIENGTSLQLQRKSG